MDGHLTMSKKGRARLVVMAKVMKFGMKISEPYDGCEAPERRLRGVRPAGLLAIGRHCGLRAAWGDGSPVLDCPSARTRATPHGGICDISKES